MRLTQISADRRYARAWRRIGCPRCGRHRASRMAEGGRMCRSARPIPALDYRERDRCADQMSDQCFLVSPLSTSDHPMFLCLGVNTGLAPPVARPLQVAAVYPQSNGVRNPPYSIETTRG